MATEGVLPGITENGHIHGNSMIHMNGAATPLPPVGTMPVESW